MRFHTKARSREEDLTKMHLILRGFAPSRETIFEFNQFTNSLRFLDSALTNMNSIKLSMASLRLGVRFFLCLANSFAANVRAGFSMKYPLRLCPIGVYALVDRTQSDKRFLERLNGMDSFRLFRNPIQQWLSKTKLPANVSRDPMRLSMRVRQLT